MPYVESGEFDRDTSYIEDRITRDGRNDWPVEPGRYRLVVARACPWANRAIIVRRLLGLEHVLSMGVCGPVHDERSWTFDLDPGGRDPVLGIERLQEAYLNRFPGYPKGITVPAMVEIDSVQVVTNDFAQLTLDMSLEWRDFHRDGAPDLYPEPLRPEIDDVMAWVYRDVNNGVYRCGFAGSQEGYDAGLPTTLRRPRPVVGSAWRTSATSSATRSPKPTFACSRPWLASTPCTTGTSSATGRSSARCRSCGRYARDLFQTPGFGDTIDFDHIKHHYYEVHRDINPTGIVPVGPDLSGWLTPHGREELGGRPFGDGTPPPPPPAAEAVPADHTPLAA